MTTTSSASGAALVADDASTGTVGWTNPTKAQGVAGTSPWATNACDKDDTHYLKGTGFGLSVPTGDIVDGISVSVSMDNGGGTNPNGLHLFLVKSGTLTGTDHVTGGSFNFGGSADLWGTSWTPSDCNGSGFGVAIAWSGTANGDSVRVFDFAVTVTSHTPASGPPLPAKVPQIIVQSGGSLGGRGIQTGGRYRHDQQKNLWLPEGEKNQGVSFEGTHRSPMHVTTSRIVVCARNQP